MFRCSFVKRARFHRCAIKRASFRKGRRYEGVTSMHAFIYKILGLPISIFNKITFLEPCIFVYDMMNINIQ